MTPFSGCCWLPAAAACPRGGPVSVPPPPPEVLVEGWVLTVKHLFRQVGELFGSKSRTPAQRGAPLHRGKHGPAGSAGAWCALSC